MIMARNVQNPLGAPKTFLLLFTSSLNCPLKLLHCSTIIYIIDNHYYFI